MNTLSPLDIFLLVALILSVGLNIWLMKKKPATSAVADFDTVCELLDKQGGTRPEVDTSAPK